MRSNACPLIVFLPLADSLYNPQCAWEGAWAGLAPRSHHKLAHVAVMAGREEGYAPVFEGVKRAVGLVPRALPLALAVALCGCSDFDTSGSWFAKPLRLYG